jgi:prepilin-type N-terminal cleavage/methylation domain-containing protein
MQMLCYNNSMMKKVKAFSLVEVMVVFAIICILFAMLIPVLVTAHNRRVFAHSIVFHVGDTVSIDALSITGVVVNVNSVYNWPQATLLVKGINGLPTEINPVDIRLLKKVPPSSESEWKH